MKLAHRRSITTYIVSPDSRTPLESAGRQQSTLLPSKCPPKLIISSAGRGRCFLTLPVCDLWTLPLHPHSVRFVYVHRRPAECVAPLDDGRVVVRMRYRDAIDPSQLLDC